MIVSYFAFKIINQIKTKLKLVLNLKQSCHKRFITLRFYSNKKKLKKQVKVRF